MLYLLFRHSTPHWNTRTLLITISIDLYLSLVIMYSLRVVFCILFYWSTTVESARILAIVPTTSYSHQVFYRPLWIELANRGHEVLLVTTDPINNSSITNLKEIDLSEAYISWNASVMEMVKLNDDKVGAIKLMLNTLYDISRIELSNPELQKLYHSTDEHFDLLFVEYLLPTMNIFKYKFDVPFIGVSSLDATVYGHSCVGNPIHSVLYPNYMLGFGDKLNFFERLMAVFFDNYMYLFGYFTMIPTLDAIVRDTMGEGIPSLATIGLDVDMIFANANPLFNPIRPYTPATISIGGGFHEVPVKPLPEDLKAFMDNAKEGIIYFSLGSNVKSREISPKTREIIMQTFAQLPYKILWKFEDDTLPGKPDNVMIKKWLPQQDILRHKNTLVFITQCGLQSLEEALFARVPLVAMPFFADQETNARHVVSKGLGLQLDHKTLSTEEFKKAVLEVIKNDKYRNKVKELADLVQDQPMKPLESAVWWTEYVLRHKGAKHLHGPKIPFYQQYYFDVLGFLGAVIAILLGLIYFICKKCYSFICGMVCCKKTKTVKQKMQKKNN